MMKWSLPLLIGVMSVLYLFIPSDPLPVKVIFKLIPMFLIIVFAFRQLSFNPAPALRFILFGLFFCTLGDAFIAVSFIAGLGAFLVGHLFYLCGFMALSRMNKWRLAAALPIALYSFIFGQQLISALRTDGDTDLVIPVIVYMLVISMMAISAILTGNKWAIAGSLLFVLSDSILSWNMFVSEIPFSAVFIMTTYYSAQFLIACSLSSLQQPKETIV
ncbi:lysoplasmalogenase [Rossellomorea vietnamensis]|uniref:lysoplasmalogenase n=1 Tax=Rossellomorea vietnamensis TaxID=218284 RepID=UPI00054FB4B4|nr:lysoplasmalogenase [Rossellomorea vietnamensis]